MSEHTPETWEAQNTAGYETHGQTAVYDATGKDVALVYDGAAHAALVAAAPELLKAARVALTWYEHPAMHDTFRNDEVLYTRLNDAIRLARAAIAKAEGGTAMRGSV